MRTPELNGTECSDSRDREHVVEAGQVLGYTVLYVKRLRNAALC